MHSTGVEAGVGTCGDMSGQGELGRRYGKGSRAGRDWLDGGVQEEGPRGKEEGTDRLRVGLREWTGRCARAPCGDRAEAFLEGWRWSARRRQAEAKSVTARTLTISPPAPLE